MASMENLERFLLYEEEERQEVWTELYIAIRVMKAWGADTAQWCLPIGSFPGYVKSVWDLLEQYVWPPIIETPELRKGIKWPAAPQPELSATAIAQRLKELHSAFYFTAHGFDCALRSCTVIAGKYTRVLWPAMDFVCYSLQVQMNRANSWMRAWELTDARGEGEEQFQSHYKTNRALLDSFRFDCRAWHIQPDKEIRSEAQQDAWACLLPKGECLDECEELPSVEGAPERGPPQLHQQSEVIVSTPKGVEPCTVYSPVCHRSREEDDCTSGEHQKEGGLVSASSHNSVAVS